MASTTTSLLLPLHRPDATSRRTPAPLLSTRRRSLVLLLSSPLLFAPLPSRAVDIPLFGFRRRIEKAEEAAEAIIEEGEKELEKGVETAEEEIGGALGLSVAGDLLQAGSVAGAEAVGVLVGVSVVNGILAPEGDKL